MSDCVFEYFDEIPARLGFSRYLVSNKGNLMNSKSFYILSLKPNPHTGYIVVSLTNDTGVQQHIAVHIIVAETFVKKPKGTDLTVDHINRDRGDNRVENLRWASRREQSLNTESKHRRKGKCVIQYDGNTVVREWKNSVLAEKTLGLTNGSVTAVCRGESKLAGGFRWEFKPIKTIPGEIWKYYEEFDIYVSNKGRIKTACGNITTGYKSTRGGLSINKTGDSSCMKQVHTIVADLFIPNPSNKPYVCHKDGNKTNNCVENLVRLTYSESSKRHASKTIRSKSLSRAVKQFTLDGVFVAEYESIAKAGTETGLLRTTISKVCQGFFKQTGGYRFEYSDKTTPDVRRSKRPSRAIYLLVDGKKKLYNSALEAGKDLGVSPSNIHLVCKGTYRQTGGYRFEYA